MSIKAFIITVLLNLKIVYVDNSSKGYSIKYSHKVLQLFDFLQCNLGIAVGEWCLSLGEKALCPRFCGGVSILRENRGSQGKDTGLRSRLVSGKTRFENTLSDPKPLLRSSVPVTKGSLL